MNLSEHTDFPTEYRGMTDQQLLQIAGEGGLVEEASQALQVEMRNRKLTPDMVHTYHAETERFELAEKARIKPSFFSLGFRFYGRTYLSEDDKSQGIAVRTKWFTLRGLPIIPIASYRYSCQDVTTGLLKWKEEKIIDRVPMNWNQVMRTWVASTGLVILAISLTLLYLAWSDGHHR